MDNWQELLGWSEEDLKDLRFLGYSYLQQGHYEIAIKIFESLTIVSPNSAYDLQTTGAILLEMGKNKEALSFLDRALKIDPLHSPTLLNRAKALLMLGEQYAAIKEITKLKGNKDPKVASTAEALLMAYL